jgi:hypothetical protein
LHATCLDNVKAVPDIAGGEDDLARAKGADVRSVLGLREFFAQHTSELFLFSLRHG